MVSSHNYEYWWECKWCKDSDFEFSLSEREQGIDVHKRCCKIFQLASWTPNPSIITRNPDSQFNRWKKERKEEKEKKKATETKAPVIVWTGGFYVNSVHGSDGVI